MNEDLSNPHVLDRTAIALQEMTAHFNAMQQSREAYAKASEMVNKVGINVAFERLGGMYYAILNSEKLTQEFIGMCALIGVNATLNSSIGRMHHYVLT